MANKDSLVGSSGKLWTRFGRGRGELGFRRVLSEFGVCVRNPDYGCSGCRIAKSLGFGKLKLLKPCT